MEISFESVVNGTFDIPLGGSTGSVGDLESCAFPSLLMDFGLFPATGDPPRLAAALDALAALNAASNEPFVPRGRVKEFSLSNPCSIASVLPGEVRGKVWKGYADMVSANIEV